MLSAMPKKLRVKSAIALAGFPEGEVREVERTDMVAALLDSGMLVETKEPLTDDEAVDAPVEAAEPSAGASGAAAAPKASTSAPAAS